MVKRAFRSNLWVFPHCRRVIQTDIQKETDTERERERQADWLRTENDDTATEFSGSKGERERREEKGTNGEQAP